MKELKYIILLFTTLFLTEYAGAKTIIEKNISYKQSADSYTKEMCTLDISYEKGTDNKPVIVWFHGGGLTGGHKETPEILHRDGAVVVGIGYRLYPNASVSEILDDTAAAVAWVFNNISKFGGNTEKIFLAGHSAGGYIVNMLGLDKSWLAKYNVDADQIAAIIPYSGQVITHFTQRKSEGLDALTPTIGPLAPLAHLRADAPPMLVISGDREMELYGRYEETAYFVRMLKLKGHKNITFYELEGFNHGDMAQPAHILLLKYIKEYL